MNELNKAQDVTTLSEDNFDCLLVIDLTESLTLSQVDEDGELHDVIIGRKQAGALVKALQEFLA